MSRPKRRSRQATPDGHHALRQLGLGEASVLLWTGYGFTHRRRGTLRARETPATEPAYLFDRRTQLSGLWTRSTGRTDSSWTRDSVAGRRFGSDKPVYVLTSAHTFSGAEAFAYDLQSLKRATIVGETAAGGAHPVSDVHIDDRFVLMVPWGKAVNPVTGTNWEGVGVVPDIKVPASEALDTAESLLREKKLQ